ncbi:MAG: hypothetical protein II350_04500 [Clostridia bacterium]|nr:hypothetical protein [Oscillospiraceae bacterium]MBQ1954976.1 hypothetical protein [Clostridia bacterium]
MADMEKSGLSYRGRPLIRKDDTLYYGSMSDKYIIMLQIQDKKTVEGAELATKVSVYLQQTNENIRPKERIVRKTEKPGLYEALDVGAVWLERALADKM